MAYFLSPALVRLRSEVNALWPNRSKASDGWIGDTSHAARKSDHNPDYSAGGIVRAIDVTNAGINVDAFISSVIRDSRCRYVISRGRIWTREAGWRAYTGSNGHHSHVHVSVRTGGGYDLQVHSWGLSTTVWNNLGGGGSVSTPGAPSAPTPLEEIDLKPDERDWLFRTQQILEAWDKQRNKVTEAAELVEGLPGRVWAVAMEHPVTGKSTRAADFLRYTAKEGADTRNAVADGTSRAVAETSAAYHQTLKALSVIKPGVASVDVTALADALKAELGAAVADELADRLKG